MQCGKDSTTQAGGHCGSLEEHMHDMINPMDQQSMEKPGTTPMDPALIFEDDFFRSLTEIYSEDS